MTSPVIMTVNRPYLEDDRDIVSLRQDRIEMGILPVRHYASDWGENESSYAVCNTDHRKLVLFILAENSKFIQNVDLVVLEDKLITSMSHRSIEHLHWASLTVATGNRFCAIHIGHTESLTFLRSSIPKWDGIDQPRLFVCCFG